MRVDTARGDADRRAGHVPRNARRQDRLSLPGRVVWRSEPPPTARTTCTAWASASSRSARTRRGLLKHVVERSAAGYARSRCSSPVSIEPVVARARTRSNGLRLSAALPIFARDTELSFQLDEEGPELIGGRIGNARVATRTRTARAASRSRSTCVEPEETGRYRRRARYGYPAELEAEPLRARSPILARADRARNARRDRRAPYTARGATPPGAAADARAAVSRAEHSPGRGIGAAAAHERVRRGRGVRRATAYRPNNARTHRADRQCATSRLPNRPRLAAVANRSYRSTEKARSRCGPPTLGCDPRLKFSAGHADEPAAVVTQAAVDESADEATLRPLTFMSSTRSATRSRHNPRPCSKQTPRAFAFHSRAASRTCRPWSGPNRSRSRSICPTAAPHWHKGATRSAPAA